MSEQMDKHKGHRLEVSSLPMDDGYNVAVDCWTCWCVVEDKDVATSDDAADLAAVFRKEAGIL